MTEFVVSSARQVPDWMPRLLRSAAWYAVDMVFVFALFFLYFLGRGLPQDRIELSTRNAFRIIDAEQSLGVFWEPAWQQAVIGNERMVDLSNFTYLNLHMPLLVALGFAFLLADSRKHRLIRNAIVFSAFLAIPIYAAFPVTPPRLMGSAGYPLGIFDTIPTSLRDKPGELANWYAAVPSYHFGWIALAMAGVWWCWKHWVIRGVAVAFAAWMWCAIVFTGNHYFLDMVAGAGMVSVAFWLAVRFERWCERNPEQAARFTVRAGPLRLPF